MHAAKVHNERSTATLLGGFDLLCTSYGVLRMIHGWVHEERDPGAEIGGGWAKRQTTIRDRSSRPSSIVPARSKETCSKEIEAQIFKQEKPHRKWAQLPAPHFNPIQQLALRRWDQYIRNSRSKYGRCFLKNNPTLHTVSSQLYAGPLTSNSPTEIPRF